MRELCRALAACVVALLVECVLHAPASLSAPGPQKNSSLVHELRRQLMENNYDYMPSESEEPLGTQSLFKQKANNIVKTNKDETTTITTTTITSTTTESAAGRGYTHVDRNAGRSYTHVDKSHPKFYSEFDDSNKEYGNLDIHNNLNTEPDGQYNNNLDRDYRDVKQEHDKIDQKLKKQEFDNRIDKDYAILKKEHDKLDAKFERDLPNRDYESPYLYDKSNKDFDKSNLMLDDTQDVRESESDNNFMDEKRKTKYGKLHYDDTLNEDMKEKLKKHHNDRNNKQSNMKEVEVEKQFGYLDNEMGFLPRANEDSEAPDESSDTSKKHSVHKNDLLYYMNDERLKQAEENYMEISNASAEEGRTSSSGSSSGSGSGSGADDDYDDQTTTTVKYNVFTVRAERGGRRADGQGQTGTFVREQRPGEVVVLRLDDAPFPQFRLPAARRQYMHAQNNK